jgi:GDPmannose 4,6-dehydratase
MVKRALVTGVTGQDGAYLARLLVERGYEVFGGVRRRGPASTWRLEALGVGDRVRFVDFELLDEAAMKAQIDAIRPDEIYNLAGQSLVSASFDQPLYTARTNGIAVAHMLEILRRSGRETLFYQASTSEMYGRAATAPQREDTAFWPLSPYAIAKVYAHSLTANYREAYGLRACAGILFNHESPLRGLDFVTRKITSTLARIKALNLAEPLGIGNLDVMRDWGFAGEYVEGMWRMLQHDPPEDYVLATGRTHSVREFVTTAAAALGFELEWEGEGIGEVARDRVGGRVLVRVERANFRPVDVKALVGDPGKADRLLGWKAAVSFPELVAMMVAADYDRARAGRPFL